MSQLTHSSFTTVKLVSELQHFSLNTSPFHVPFEVCINIYFYVRMYKRRVEQACILFQHRPCSYSLSQTPERCPVKSVHCSISAIRTGDYAPQGHFTHTTLTLLTDLYVWKQYLLRLGNDEQANITLVFMRPFRFNRGLCFTVNLEVASHKGTLFKCKK